MSFHCHCSFLLTSASCSVFERAFTAIKTTFLAAKISYRVDKKRCKAQSEL